MSENTTNKNVRDDEIDLLDLFKRMGRTFNRWGAAIGRAILISIVFILKRWLPLGLSVALGVGISYILKYTSSSFFTSDMIFRSNGIPNSELISYINRLHNYCLENNSAALSNALSVSHESVDNIIDINAYWIIDKNRDGIPDYVDFRNTHDVYDTMNIRMQDRMNIRTIIKSPQELSLVRDGLIKFINSDSLFQQRNRIRIRQNNEMLSRLDYDILQLDSLQKVKYFEETRNSKPQSGGQMIFLQEQKTQLIYTDIYDLYEKKQRIEAERDLYKEIVTLLSDFSLPAKRDNGGLFYAKKIVPIFFGLTLLILILFANRKKLEEIYRKY